MRGAPLTRSPDDLLAPEPAVVFDMLTHMNHRAQQFSVRERACVTARVGFVAIERAVDRGESSVLVVREPHFEARP